MKRKFKKKLKRERQTERKTDSFMTLFLVSALRRHVRMMFYLGKHTSEKTQGFNQSVEDNKNPQTLNNFS